MSASQLLLIDMTSQSDNNSGLFGVNEKILAVQVTSTSAEMAERREPHTEIQTPPTVNQVKYCDCIAKAAIQSISNSSVLDMTIK